MCSLFRGQRDEVSWYWKQHRAAAAELNLMGNRKTILATTGLKLHGRKEGIKK